MHKSVFGMRGRRVLIEATTIVVTGAFLAQGAVPDARAAEVIRTAVVAPSPVAKTAPKKHAPPAPPAAETYGERQDRIAQSTDPLLKTPPTPEPTTCVSGEFTTLAVVYESLKQSLLPDLPPAVREAVLANDATVRREMANITVSTLALSEHPKTLGADDDDPAVAYRSPQSQLIVSDLLKIRDGKQNDAIPVANITLSEAVETAWLYFFTGVLAPARLAVGLAPNIFDLTGGPVDSLSFLSYGTLLSVGFAVIRLGLTQAYSAISNAILERCVARVTEEQKSLAGKPSETVVYDIPIHPIIQSIANQLGLADEDTCTPVGDLTLGRIVKRTGDAAKAQAPNAVAKRRIDAQVSQILRQMKATAIPLNLIPADPADFSTAETIGSYVGGMLPYVGGAPLDILIGLGHNMGTGANMGATVSLDRLTVTKSLIAAYYSYYLAVHLFTEVGDALTNPAGVAPSPFRIAGALLSLPLEYGLVTYHNVVRSMCLIEDDTTGTGLGAEKNKRDYEAGVRPDADTTARTRRVGATSSATPTKKAPKTTPKTDAPRRTTTKTTPRHTPAAR